MAGVTKSAARSASARSSVSESGSSSSSSSSCAADDAPARSARELSSSWLAEALLLLLLLLLPRSRCDAFCAGAAVWRGSGSQTHQDAGYRLQDTRLGQRTSASFLFLEFLLLM
jgi:hypothetical protein